MNEAEFRNLVEDHARFPGALLAVFQGADLEMMRGREADGKWSPLEILAHLRDEEVSDEDRRKILRDNTAKLYGFNVD